MPFITTKNPAWRELLGVTNYDFYHLPEYAELDAELLKGEAVGWYYEKGDLRCLIPLIKRAIPGKPAMDRELYDLVSPYGYPGMLCNKKIGEKKANAVFEVFDDEATAAGFVSGFVRLNPFINKWDLEPLTWPGGRFNSRGEYYLMETDYDPVLYGYTAALDLRHNLQPLFSENHRRNLTKLHKKGYCAIVNDWSHLPSFIDAYYQTMTRRAASDYYFFPQEYFKKLRDASGERLYLINVLSPEGEFVSGGLFTVFNGIMQYHLGATTDQAVAISPSKLVIEEAIAIGIAMKTKWLHLGGGLGADSTDGLYRFKRGFAGTKLPYTCLQFILDYDNYRNLCIEAGLKEEYESGAYGYFPLYRS